MLFRRRKLRSTAGSASVAKIHLNDMKLVDIPPTQSLVYLRYKQGRSGAETRKYPILRNSVSFAEPIIFDYEMPSDRHSHHPKPLRLSFRMENPSNSGFTRYGIVELDVMQCILDSQFDLRFLLSECSYNTYFVAKLELPEGSPFPSSPRSVEFLESTDASSPSSSGPPSTSRNVSHPVSVLSQVSSSSSTSTMLFETAPVKVSREKFDQLEKQVDIMLAGIINGEDERGL
jgi:hypothetical protein